MLREKTMKANEIKEAFYRYIDKNDIHGIRYKNKNTVTVILSNPISPDKSKKYHISMSDVFNYYNPKNQLGCNGLSGMRKLGEFIHDWRYVDSVASQLCHLFQRINMQGFESEMKRMGIRRR